MDAILNYRPEGSEDYYALLGCDELSSVSRVAGSHQVAFEISHVSWNSNLVPFGRSFGSEKVKD
jgi:hypothetical protein